MKLNYEATFTTLTGDPILDEKGNPLTLRQAVITACSMAVPGDEQLDPIAKYKVGEIAVCAHKGLDLTTDQVADVKRRVAKGFTSPVLVYFVHEALEKGGAEAA